MNPISSKCVSRALCAIKVSIGIAPKLGHLLICSLSRSDASTMSTRSVAQLFRLKRFSLLSLSTCQESILQLAKTLILVLLKSNCSRCGSLLRTAPNPKKSSAKLLHPARFNTRSSGLLSNIAFKIV